MTNYKPFDLEKAKAGAPIITRAGAKCRIVCFDRSGEFPLVVLAHEDYEAGIYEYLSASRLDGSCAKDKAYDLFMAPVKKKRWVCLVREKNGNITSDSSRYKESLIQMYHLTEDEIIGEPVCIEYEE